MFVCGFICVLKQTNHQSLTEFEYWAKWAESLPLWLQGLWFYFELGLLSLFSRHIIYILHLLLHFSSFADY